MADQEDRRAMRDGIRYVRELVSMPAFQDYTGDEIFPGINAQDDDDLNAVMREHINTQWHLSGTARMGRQDNSRAVVDPEGRIHGLNGARIVDASIMPEVTNGNTNARTIMMAEKLSDAIRGRFPLPRSDLDVWQHPDWETSQR